MKLATTLIFIMTYLMIAGRLVRLLPIGRPGGALLGAVAMVAIGAISPEASYQAVDHETIVLLFAMMVLAVYLEEAHFFTRIGSWLVARAKTPWGLLVGFSLLSAVGSAFLLNDTVCVFLTPLVVATCERAKLPMGPYLIALATSANIGSTATLVGNPQNILIGSMGGLHFAQYSLLAIGPCLIGIFVNILLLRIYYYKKLPAEIPAELLPSPKQQFKVPTAFVTALEGSAKIPLSLIVLAGVIVGLFLGFDRGYTALAGVMVMVLAQREDPRPQLGRVDWALLVFFCALFIVVAAFARTGFIADAWKAAAPYMNLGSASGIAAFSALMTLGSNLVSNVPLVVLTGPYLAEQHAGLLGWSLLAFVTTVAGNLTIVGSVANIIVAETARTHYVLGFREYLRFGAVSTFAVLLVGVPAEVLLSHFLP